MKRLEISRLMDEYTDTEFFPTGGSVANPEAVKGWVLANVKAPVVKKRMPRKKKLLLAAALAAMLVVLVGAGLPYIQYIQHQLINGTITFEQTEDGKRTSYSHSDTVVVCENGRLIFTQADGQRIDITDLVSEETPYIYDGSDPDDGMINYTIMGGTPECFGWFDWVQTPYPFDDGAAINFDESGNPINIMYSYGLINYPEGFQSGCTGGDTVYLKEYMKRPWLLAGIEQLDITFQDPPEGEENVYIRAQS